jgi:ubiquitin thioesterase OTU1
MDSDLIPMRRYMNADNSCLFSSIAYLIDHKNFDETSSLKFRMMIPEYLINNDLKDVILDCPKNEYIEKIQNFEKWGGAIELRIFSDIFKIKIGSIDVMTNRIDIYGETKPYDKIMYVIYNGIHYDPLVMNFSHDANNELDITKFKFSNHNILIKFREYVLKIKDSGDYVDLSKLNSLECEICNEKFINESKAGIHAKKTNHWNFKQI